MGTRTDFELEEARARVAQLEAKQAEEEAAKASASPAVRELAVALHTLLCPDAHPEGCGWFIDAAADEPEGADWTQEDHQLWLDRTRRALGWMAGHGWKVTPPGESEPLPAPANG